MKEKIYKNISIILSIIIPLYFFSLVYLKISLIGFWSDIICFSFFIYFGFRFLKKIKKVILRVFLLFLNIAYLIIFTLGLIIIMLGTLSKSEHFYFIKVNDRLFNAYVNCGIYHFSHDNLTLTESFKFFPISEKKVFYEDKFLDFDVIETDGNGTDEEKMESLKAYIKHEVIDKNK